MPVFVVFEMGAAPRGVSIERSTVRVGRERACDVVLAGASVSREHAVFTFEDGRWFVACASRTNPLVVEGAVVASKIEIDDGTEILVGADHLLVFARDEARAKEIAGGPVVAQHRCAACGWKGLFGLRRAPVCPSCGGTSFGGRDSRAPARADATFELRDEDAFSSWKRLQSAKHSSLERVGDAGRGKRLSEREPLSIGPDTRAPLKLEGIVFGSIEVRWEDGHYVVVSALRFPKMKVNGAKVERARLANGDVIDVGTNRFRFATE